MPKVDYQPVYGECKLHEKNTSCAQCDHGKRIEGYIAITTNDAGQKIAFFVDTIK